ncbi:hypothetical protein AVEN_186169-1 [Araneus ventricosus]|uniref:Mutator-like transposase domain-containing protein n=1 Tax=Araneus ventricosus TaxID=182803 RepID=A0A4Y2GH57_ARAVE|nr:hypothetical protein AVEN_186169-1 [Araneus ventricosus]
MDTFSRRYRKLKGRPSKRKLLCAFNISKKWQKDKVENFDISVCAENCVSNEVSYDDTWQERRHTSLYDIGIVVDILTGLVIAYEILSKYYPEFTTAKRDIEEHSADFSKWYKEHKPECSENYVGSPNAMEIKAAEILWTSSVENCGIRYMNVLSDGDSKTYQQLLKLDVYGDSMNISREECLNHVAKRLGTGLSNKVKEWRNKCVTIGGRKKGRLKESTILNLTNFYRKAIKDNVPDVQKMKTAIFASLFYISWTDKTLKHNKCPTGLTSWCFYQRAMANNEKSVSFVNEDKVVRANSGKNTICVSKTCKVRAVGKMCLGKNPECK